MSKWSYDWWFRDRNTGEIVIGQTPNWPLLAIVVGWVVRFIATDGSTFHDIVGWSITALWVFWSGDEIVRGVNPWRRVLGAIVLTFTVVSRLT